MLLWVTVMAGLKPTPAEEMDGFIDSEPPVDAPVHSYTPQGATKPAPQSSTPPPPLKQEIPDNLYIAALLKKLGIDPTDKDQTNAAVRSITELELIPANFDKIIDRLSVRLEEQRKTEEEAERLKETNAAPVTA
jgi:hypothetical protein